MKNYTILLNKYTKIALFVFIVSFLFQSNNVNAYVIPTFSFTQTNSLSTNVKVYGDPNSSVALHYGNLASMTNTIGTTDEYGNLSVYLSSSSYSLACGNTAYVSINGIQSATIPWTSSSSDCKSMPLSKTSVDLSKGQSTTITATSNTNIFIASNSNPSVVNSNVVGSNIYLTAASYGVANIIVCTNDNVNTCGTISVSVYTSGTTTTTSSDSTSVSFSNNNVLLEIDATKTVTVYGQAGGYYISSNSSPSSANASISGNVISLRGISFGGSTITVCQNTGGCSPLYVAVVNSNQTQTSTSTTAGIPPKISSLSFSVSNISSNKIEDVNNTLTLSFSTNTVVNTPSVYIDSNRVSVSGSGYGPYTATYKMTDSNNPLVVSINLTSSSGVSGSSSFYIGNKISNSTTVTTPATGTTTGTVKTFITTLKVGSVGTEVRNLQAKLKTLKFYSGVVDGKFGAGVTKAIKAFQKAHKLEQTGTTGPKTRELLNK